MRRPLLAIPASAGAIALVLMAGAPASAAELPSSDVLYLLPDEGFYSSTSTGESTFISDLPAGGKYGADFDSTTGLGYFFIDGTPCTLYSIVPETGVYTEIGPVGDTGMDECDALNVASDGTLRIADQDGVMLTVDKATGATLSSVTIDTSDISFIDQTSTGQFYVGTYGGELYTLDVQTGAAVFVDQPTDYIETANFDSSDTLWISGSGDGCQGLSSLSLSDPTATFQFQGNIAEGEDCLSAYSMFIAGATQPVPAQLAETGSAMPTWLLPVAVLSLIAGAGALLVGRRARES